MISIQHLTKSYGRPRVVDDLSFDVPSGGVTGFLGPNGAGKSTTMRMILGLDHPDAGVALIDGRRMADLEHPLRHVGALLDAGYAHPTRSARDHLRAYALANAIGLRRVDEVLGIVGLAGVAGRRVGQLSLGMRQRLGLAGAMLGEPGTMILDEPVNGLDPEGIHWMRELLARFADEGRTVFVSSHLLSEMALIADRIVIIGQGRLIAETTVDELTSTAMGRTVFVRSTRLGDLFDVLRLAGASVSMEGAGLSVRDWDSARVGQLAFEHTIPLSELTLRAPSLESVYLDLTASVHEYRGTANGAVSSLTEEAGVQ